MQNVQVQFNTRTYGVKSSTKELRRRYRQSESFKRLLHAAAAAQLRNRPVTLKGSNPKATRALERAVCGVRRTMELDTKGHAARVAYLMRDSKTWTEVHKATAVKAMRETTPDTLAVMPVWVYSPTISNAAAAKLDAMTAPERVVIEEASPEFSENRESESAHPNHFEEDASTYNDAGELETPTERRERLAREGVGTERKETFEDAWRPLPLKKYASERAPVEKKELPAAPFYYASQEKFPEWAKEEMKRRQAADDARRVKLRRDNTEVDEHADLDEFLAPDDLETDMLEPWEAMERYASSR